VGYISPIAAILLWILGLIITGTAVYLVYWAAVRYLSPLENWVLAALLLMAGGGILVFWGFALSRGVFAAR
jgi:hypothetical protein